MGEGSAQPTAGAGAPYPQWIQVQPNPYGIQVQLNVKSFGSNEKRITDLLFRRAIQMLSETLC